IEHAFRCKLSWKPEVDGAFVLGGERHVVARVHRYRPTRGSIGIGFHQLCGAVLVELHEEDAVSKNRPGSKIHGGVIVSDDDHIVVRVDGDTAPVLIRSRLTGGIAEAFEPN